MYMLQILCVTSYMINIDHVITCITLYYLIDLSLMYVHTTNIMCNQLYD